MGEYGELFPDCIAFTSVDLGDHRFVIHYSSKGDSLCHSWGEEVDDSLYNAKHRLDGVYTAAKDTRWTGVQAKVMDLFGMKRLDGNRLVGNWSDCYIKLDGDLYLVPCNGQIYDAHAQPVTPWMQYQEYESKQAIGCMLWKVDESNNRWYAAGRCTVKDMVEAVKEVRVD